MLGLGRQIGRQLLEGIRGRTEIRIPKLEASAGFEPAVEVLHRQSSAALPSPLPSTIRCYRSADGYRGRLPSYGEPRAPETGDSVRIHHGYQLVRIASRDGVRQLTSQMRCARAGWPKRNHLDRHPLSRERLDIKGKVSRLAVSVGPGLSCNQEVAPWEQVELERAVT